MNGEHKYTYLMIELNNTPKELARLIFVQAKYSPERLRLHSDTFCNLSMIKLAQ